MTKNRKRSLGAAAIAAALSTLCFASAAPAQSMGSLQRSVGVLTRTVGTLSAISAINESSCTDTNEPKVGFPNGVGSRPNAFARVNLFPTIPQIPLEPNSNTMTFNVNRSNSYPEGSFVRIPSTPVTTPTRFMVQCPFTMTDAFAASNQVLAAKAPSSGGVKFLDAPGQVDLGAFGPFHFVLTCAVSGGTTLSSFDVFSTQNNTSLDGNPTGAAGTVVNIHRVDDTTPNQPGTVNQRPSSGAFNQTVSASTSTELSPDGAELDITYNTGVNGLGHRCFGGFTGQRTP